ncbi:hypothetical protein PAXRUDRAFT_564299 [Paxillus rubicundulus Ve08.2h10]|uniref:Uncharacterized protein n=1 Tax=Paxillus rubicundulus Ve08.2h10 TaxID=930991 RepID=A0A0D0DVX1_9AGAM|nr:hypothetical protein PAXRUDRAFT_564299 [Paxillus rubicundulus Ve08.2h10]
MPIGHTKLKTHLLGSRRGSHVNDVGNCGGRRLGGPCDGGSLSDQLTNSQHGTGKALRVFNARESPANQSLNVVKCGGERVEANCSRPELL